MRINVASERATRGQPPRVAAETQLQRRCRRKRGFRRSAQSKRQRAPACCAVAHFGSTDSEERARGFSSRGSPHKATPGPICLNSCNDRMRQVPRTFEAGARNKIRVAVLATRTTSHRRMFVSNREAARDCLCLDCVKGCLKVQKQTSRKHRLLCISCAGGPVSCANPAARCCPKRRLPPSCNFHSS